LGADLADAAIVGRQLAIAKQNLLNIVEDCLLKERSPGTWSKA